MEITNEEKYGLADFFTYDYQSRLIKNAQMLDSDYENAISEYSKFFLVDLIKCMRIDEINNRNSDIVELVRELLQNKSLIKIEPAVIEENRGPNSLIEISQITEFFLEIREVYHRWTSCDVETAMTVIKRIFNEKLQFWSSDVDKKEVSQIETLFRGRVSDRPLEKVDMFHIPFMQAYKIRNQRFSLTGQPLLYLTNSIEGVFNELSVESSDYEKLYIAQYRFKQYEDKKAYVYDLTIDGGKLLQSQKGDIDSFRRQFYKFILSCVCSFPNIRGRDNCFFVEEYVIPQLVTQLIKKSSEFDGICYNTVIFRNNESCKVGKPMRDASEEINNIYKDDDTERYINYAFFANNNDKNASIDLKLRNAFIIDGPVTIGDLPDFNPIKDNCDKEQIIKNIDKYFSYISDMFFVPEEIRKNNYFEQLQKEISWIYRDGEYRYIHSKSK